MVLSTLPAYIYSFSSKMVEELSRIGESSYCAVASNYRYSELPSHKTMYTATVLS
jgi:hypothetical protein